MKCNVVRRFLPFRQSSSGTHLAIFKLVSVQFKARREALPVGSPHRACPGARTHGGGPGHSPVKIS